MRKTTKENLAKKKNEKGFPTRLNMDHTYTGVSKSRFTVVSAILWG